MISFKVRNLDRVKAKLDVLPLKVRRIATEEAARYLIGDYSHGLQYYPPPPPASKYKRTYDLRFGWRVSAWGDGVRIKIQNAVKYAPYVQGNDTQAWMHVGRWRTVSVIVRDNIKGAMRRIDEAVARYIKSQGL